MWTRCWNERRSCGTRAMQRPVGKPAPSEREDGEGGGGSSPGPRRSVPAQQGKALLRCDCEGAVVGDALAREREQYIVPL